LNTVTQGKAVEWLIVTLLLCATLFLIGHQGLLNPQLGGLDEAHNVMDGVFFRDFYATLPLSELKSFPLEYYKQYPALGFIFWPPFFPAIEGLLFLIGGITLLTAQLSIMLFGLALALSVYGLLRKDLPAVPALLGSMALIASPGLHPFFNSIMREVPTLAMMALTLLLYRQATATAALWRWLLLGLVASLSLYTKQTAFVLLIAIAVDLIVNQRHQLKQKGPWLGLALATVLTIPLILFTWKFGKANLAQSIGEGTQMIMSDYAGPSRWSLQSWTFYATSLAAFFNPILLLGLLASPLFSFRMLGWWRTNTLNLAWIALFYLIFSYFDNKSERFVSLIAIPATLLATQFIWSGIQPFFRQAKTVSAWLLGIAVCWSAWSTHDDDLVTMKGIDDIMTRFDIASSDGNFAYFGDYRQVFVYYIRLGDVNRSHYVLQGDDLLMAASDLDSRLHDYQIRYIFVEPDNLNTADKAALEQLQSLEQVSVAYSGEFYRGKDRHRFIALRNNGELAASMRPFDLSSNLVD
jgi:4-amino-4-deoxy-L-arabinose transferase-like glycosyltransferase